MRLNRWLLTILLVCLVVPTAAAEEGSYRCFEETGYCMAKEFESYWSTNGSLPVFGYPIHPLAGEYATDGPGIINIQYFERNRLEYHPNHAGTPYSVLLGLLGKEVLLEQGREIEAPEAGPKAGCLWFEQTGHNVCDQEQGVGFKTYWENHGLKLQGLDKYTQSLQLFGLPLTTPQLETNAAGDTVMTQWFERARFEWHPNNPSEFKVLLGLLGSERAIQVGFPSYPENQEVFNILSYKTYYLENNTELYIIGEIQNISSMPISTWNMVVRFYDKNNHLVDAQLTYLTPQRLGPNKRGVFEISLDRKFGQDFVAFDYLTVQVDWYETQGWTPAPDYVQILSHSPQPSPTGNAAQLVTGTVLNTSDKPLAIAIVMVSAYNAEGQLVAFGEGETRGIEDIPVGATAPFEVSMKVWDSSIVRYEITATGFRVDD